LRFVLVSRKCYWMPSRAVIDCFYLLAILVLAFKFVVTILTLTKSGILYHAEY
jgi:hypothetical protein